MGLLKGVEMVWTETAVFSTLTPFAKAVYTLCTGVRTGCVTTYGALGETIYADRPSAQAVGTALHNNPFAPEVPCHRVLKGGTTPSIGGFNGIREGSAGALLHPETQKKLTLLKSEGVLFDEKLRIVDTSRVFTSEKDWDPTIVALARSYLTMPQAWSKRAAAARDDAAPAGAGESHVRSKLSVAGSTGDAVRQACRTGALSSHTSGLAPGYAQANLVIVPKEHAYDFLLFCTRNPKPCPLLEVTEAGQAVLAHKQGNGGAGTGAGAASSPVPIAPGARSVAPGADLRTDLPQYVVWKNGVNVEQPTDIRHLWIEQGAAGKGKGKHHPDARDDWVAFLLGCSFSFEEALLKAGLPVRHLQETKAGEGAGAGAGAGDGAGAGAGAGTEERPNKRAKHTDGAPSGGEPLVSNPRNVPMYRTSLPCAPSGPFTGPLVVSMRPMSPAQAQQAKDITGKYPRVHGACVHIGTAADIGIDDIHSPDYGDAVTIRAGEVPVFWACGVTPQAALLAAKLPIAITHAPGHMLVLDVKNEELAGEAGVR